MGALKLQKYQMLLVLLLDSWGRKATVGAGGVTKPFHLIDGALLYIGSMELVPPRLLMAALYHGRAI